MTRDAIVHLRADPTIGPLVEDYGDLTIEPAEDTFRRLVRSIISQQVSTASATAIRGRLYESFDVTPTALLSADPEELKAVGLSRQKVEYVQNVAHAYEVRGFSRSYFADMSDGEVIDELTSIRGIGPWTAKMYLMFCLGRPDVFPIEDLGVRTGMQTLFGESLTTLEMMDQAEPWRPYRSTASRYLWRIID